MMPWLVVMTSLKRTQLSMSPAELAEEHSSPKHRNSQSGSNMELRTAMVLTCLETAGPGAG